MPEGARSTNVVERLPEPPPSIGLTLEQAAAFLGMPISRFEDEVEAGRLPKPQRFGRTKIWHREQLRRRFDEIYGLAETRPINLDDEL